MKHISADAKHIRNFLDSCDGNWHNCLYVSCRNCKFPGTCEEPDFLFHPDENALPLILTLADAKALFARVPEPEECILSLSFHSFRTMYDAYLKKVGCTDNYCPCMALLKAQEEKNYAW